MVKGVGGMDLEFNVAKYFHLCEYLWCAELEEQGGKWGRGREGTEKKGKGREGSLSVFIWRRGEHSGQCYSKLTSGQTPCWMSVAVVLRRQRLKIVNLRPAWSTQPDLLSKQQKNKGHPAVTSVLLCWVQTSQPWHDTGVLSTVSGVRDHTTGMMLPRVRAFCNWKEGPYWASSNFMFPFYLGLWLPEKAASSWRLEISTES